MSDRPCVLVFSGADPSGGAGMAADIQAITAMGAHALPVLTAITVQDNNRVHAVMPVAAEVVLQQARALLAQVPVAAVKIGIPGSAENAQAIATLIGELRATHRAAAGAAPGWAQRLYSDPPVVLDPVLRSGHGDALGRDDALQALAPLLPLATLITPNGPEAAALAGNAARYRMPARLGAAATAGAAAVKRAAAASMTGAGAAPEEVWEAAAGGGVAGELALADALPMVALATPGVPRAWHGTAHGDALAHARALRALGCTHVLVTGGHDEGSDVVINRWLGPDRQQNWSWPRLAGGFHGSGCTLAAATAALLALGNTMAQALTKAQGYTQRALAASYAIAPGQRIPQR
ncbi:Phosphomethylpyrimidine kinase [Duganella sp. CF458]|uniref:bifunctional hydroxymethylpyrimidine kinase/phosphomethylpyrimidine kinase n=1 Tax=Duganella sp. CF458 TaxID=1884368 RepID=UPI0008EEE9EE|nr:bifunctional hydroxymethylpyrimidine kinase/phosphomethylpyrimidine kinase [Duganella sp. CF458]SFG96522.1 Phosphomethylpyrimidine kinase [Duganella sp. CF458]